MKTTLIVSIALMLFFAGCASTQTNQTTATTATGGQKTGTTQSGGQTAETASTEATASTIQATVDNAAVNYKDRLTNLFALVKDYAVTYSVTTQRGNNPPASNQITYYIKGDNTRLDTTTTRGAKTYETRYYTVDNQSASCTDSSGSWTCSKIRTPKILADMKDTILDNIQTSTITPLADKVVLGTSAKCYRLVMNLTKKDNAVAKRIIAAGMQKWEGTYCGTDQAAMLYYESTNNNMTITLEATNYKAGTGSSDFTLPATTNTPAGPAGEQDSGTYGLG